MNDNVIILDRDGVINVDRGYTHSNLEFCKGTLIGLQKLSKKCKLHIATNQSGVARGYYTEANMLAFNSEIVSYLSQIGVKIENIKYCPHAPTTIQKDQCDCRKPSPGMLLEILSEYNCAANFTMIGDSASDMIAAHCANITNRILVRTGKCITDEAIRFCTAVFDTLDEASDYYLENIYENK